MPGWAYFSDELLELEKDALFRRHWQLACHVSDVPDAGDYNTFDVGEERALIVRGHDGKVRGFHNLCRHRGSRVVAEERGSCRGALICPYHGWAYNLDGTLRGAAQPQTLPDLDPVEWGLKPLDTEIWQGFIFIRFKTSDQPSVARIMGRFDAELAPYALPDMVPVDKIQWSDETAVNWKAVRDVDNEGYHVAKAHPALHDLYGQGYVDEPFVSGASRSFATFNPGPGSLWSVRAYKAILPEASWLPESHRRAWLYVAMFPNTVIGLYPDSTIFYQEFPDGVGNTKLRGAIYRRSKESREMRLARYLSGRIDAITSAEDQLLTIWSCEAAQSSAYDGIILSDLEYGVKTHHDHLRSVLPVLNLDEEPAPDTMADLNAALLAQVCE
ncbi:aromatic ring-hydroxylating oxygenase subunit alpha [Albidovulum aquaemixtae]|uniref:aromatic ring-hydroxylating oxygenase subunit alpha n=1 Tax=Albidovulum aquaemixtae TaxID=1542388 RepID=UPI001FE30EAA|nr:aromatic ring-hydroxylating dioxygenase subunit alpha [Defluviimonas aquaemixtae]